MIVYYGILWYIIVYYEEDAELLSGSMLGILYTFWVMRFLTFMQKGCFFSSWGNVG